MKKTVSAMAMLIAAAMVAQGAVIVSWGPTTDSVVANQNIAQNTTFTDASYQSPAVGPNYNNTAAVASPDFYAALSHTASTSFTVFNGASNDLLGRWQGTATAGAVQSIMLAWDVTSTETLDSYTINGIGSFGGMTQRALRWLVQDSAGDWYASNEINGFGENVDITSNVGVLSWVSYTPHASGAVTFGGAATPSLTDVQKVGFYHQWTTDGGGGVYQTGFQVSTIPEPATLGMVAAFGGAVLFVRRRFQI